jgi:hypothetical protein
MTQDCRLAGAGVVLALAGCAGTSGDASRGVVVRDSAGVEIVENSAEHVAALPVWTLDTVPIARVAGDAPGNEFSMVRDAVRRADGRFILADQRQRDIREFTPGGAFSRLLLGAGRGPGEVGVVERLQLLPADSLAYMDAGNRRFSVFGPDGRFAGQHGIPRFADGTAARLIARLDDGRILGLMRRPYAPLETVHDSVFRERFAVMAFTMAQPGIAAATATRVDTIAVVPDMELYTAAVTESGQTSAERPQLRYGRTTYVGAGSNRVYIGTNERNEIVRYGRQGPVRRIRNGAGAAPFTAADRERSQEFALTGLDWNGASPAAQEWRSATPGGTWCTTAAAGPWPAPSSRRGWFPCA